MIEMDTQAIALRLVRLRKALGLRPSEVADLTGVDRSTWTKLEKGERDLRIQIGLQIHITLGVSLDYLYLGDLSSLKPSLRDALLAQKRV